MSSPRVALDAPLGWRPAQIAPPKISESAGAELAQHASFRAPDDSGAITLGCVATSIPGWVEDMRVAVEGRTVALAGASAAIASGVPIDARADGRGDFELRAAGDLSGPVIGHARTFLGFAPGQVHTCFATCTRAATCRAVIDTARLEGSSAPPAPGLALGAVTWSVHHPRPFALGAGIVVAVAGFLAVVLRRRARHHAR